MCVCWLARTASKTSHTLISKNEWRLSEKGTCDGKTYIIELKKMDIENAS